MSFTLFVQAYPLQATPELTVTADTTIAQVKEMLIHDANTTHDYRVAPIVGPLLLLLEHGSNNRQVLKDDRKLSDYGILGDNAMDRSRFTWRLSGQEAADALAAIAVAEAADEAAEAAVNRPANVPAGSGGNGGRRGRGRKSRRGRGRKSRTRRAR